MELKMHYVLFTDSNEVLKEKFTRHVFDFFLWFSWFKESGNLLQSPIAVFKCIYPY